MNDQVLNPGLWEVAVKQIPALGLFAGFVVVILRGFFVFLTRYEDKRTEAMDARHAQYFQLLNSMNSRTADAIVKNTEAHEKNIEVLGAVKEALRVIK